MQIQSNPNITFQAKLSTASVLETTSLRIFKNNGLDGLKSVVLALNEKPFKATGVRGYRYYAEKIGLQITEKYPQIKSATEKINEFLKENPNISKKELLCKVQPLIDNLGEEIDIII